MRQQVSHQPCQRKDGDTDTLQYGEEETAVDVAPEFPEFEPAEQFQRSRIKTFDRLDQFAVNSRNKGDRPARYSRDNIRHSHCAAFQRQQHVSEHNPL